MVFYLVSSCRPTTTTFLSCFQSFIHFAAIVKYSKETSIVEYVCVCASENTESFSFMFIFHSLMPFNVNVIFVRDTFTFKVKIHTERKKMNDSLPSAYLPTWYFVTGPFIIINFILYRWRVRSQRIGL